MRRFLWVMGGLVFFQALLVFVFLSVERERAGPTKKKPPFTYEKLSGDKKAPPLLLETPKEKVSLSSYQGRLVLLHFWATWCVPCREELPGLLEFSQRPEWQGKVALVAVSDEPWSKIAKFFAGEIPPGIFRDEAGEGIRLFEVSTLPDTYLLGPNGEILVRLGGERDWTSKEATRLLEGMLQGQL